MAHDRCSKCGGSAYKVCSGCYDAMVLQNEGLRNALQKAVDDMRFDRDRNSPPRLDGIVDAEQALALKRNDEVPACGLEYTVGINDYSTCSRIQGHSGPCGRHTITPEPYRRGDDVSDDAMMG